MRNFYKISFKQFKNDVSDDIKLYEEYCLPKRSTKYSAGYDICSLIDYNLMPGEIVKIPTGLKVTMNDDEVLLLVDRSSLGYKYNIRIVNQVGVIDKDYYNNIDNEGHFFLKLQNEGEVPYHIELHSRIAQGIFIKYLTVDDEEIINNERKGGIGSTDKGDK